MSEAIRKTRFDGIRPRVSDRLLDESTGTVAENVNLFGENICPMQGLGELVKEAPGAKTIYQHECSDTWLCWDAHVNVVPSPIHDDKHDRVYWSGDGCPKMAACENGELSTWELGIDCPTGTLDVEVVDVNSTSWTRKWFGWWEEPNGTRICSQNHLREGNEILEIVPGQEYRISALPPCPEASDDAVFIFGFTAQNQLGQSFGILYPDESLASGNSTLYINGARANATVTGTSLAISYVTNPLQNTTSTTCYVYTYVSIYNEESCPNLPSAFVDLYPTNEQIISGFVNPNDPRIDRIRLYRKATGLSGESTFRFVDEFPVSEGSYRDIRTDADLIEQLPSEDWTPPPCELQNLTPVPGVLNSGFFAGSVGKRIYFSEIGQPHAWPSFNFIDLPFNIVGLAGTFENSVVAVTTGHPYIITGSDPEAMQATKVSARQPGIAKATITDCGVYGVLYVSHDGVVQVRAGSARVLSESWYDMKLWREFDLENFVGEWHDQTYFLFGPHDTLLWDLSEDSEMLTTSTILADTAWASIKEDKMYVLAEGQVRSWCEGEPLTWRWRDRLSHFNRALDWVNRRIVSDGPVTLRLFIDNLDKEDLHLVYEEVIDDDQVCRLPVLEQSRHWAFEVQGQCCLHEVSLLTAHKQL